MRLSERVEEGHLNVWLKYFQSDFRHILKSRRSLPVRNKSLCIDCQYVSVPLPEPGDARVFQIMNLHVGGITKLLFSLLTIVHLADQEGCAPRLGREHRVRGAVEEGDVEVEEVLELLARGCHHQQGHQLCDGDHGLSLDTGHVCDEAMRSVWP